MAFAPSFYSHCEHCDAHSYDTSAVLPQILLDNGRKKDGHRFQVSSCASTQSNQRISVTLIDKIVVPFYLRYNSSENQLYFSLCIIV